MTKLTPLEIIESLKGLDPAWAVENDYIIRKFVFKNFVEAFGFMTKVAKHAESINHHPDWYNGYNKLTIKLTTHDLGGLSSKDFELARLVDSVF